ncbi:MAG: MFS transporter [Fibrobacter sp.]|jgi:acyl-[acyl-carrier-protein]-phospholipid O-acyltransferase/long-chain-fatty-acid--[acyl-carrier-protein] ligase|nr:MFS transporter [Fibrobacter sp.]
MKLSKYPSAIPFLLFVFCSIFVQMGLFVHFQRWLSFSFEGSAFWWRSMLLQVAIFSPAIFMMPAASYFAGRFHKGRVMAWSSVGMLAAVIAIVVCYVAGAEWVAYGLLGLYGVFLAVLTPAKLGIMKEMVEAEDLVKINAWYMALSVLGTAGAAFFAMGLSGRPDSPVSIELTLWIYLGLSALSTLAAFFIRVGATHDSLKFRSPRRNFAATWRHPIVRLAILGLSAIWGVTQIFLILIQNMTDMLNTAVIPISMFIVTVGYVLGALSASWASKGFVETGLIPFSAAASAITMFALPFVHNAWLQAVLYGIIGFCAGSSFVILRTVIQNFTRPDTAGRIHAVANTIQMAFLVLIMGGQTLLLIFTPVTLDYCFMILAVILALSFIMNLRHTPMPLLRAALRFAFAFVFRYRVKVVGVQNIPETGPVLLVGPHFSFIDWAVLQMSSPRPLRIASNRNTFADWYQRWFSHGKFFININRRDPAPAMQRIHDALLKGEAVVIFPEGEVSKKSFMPAFSLDYSKATEGTNAPIVPFYIQGLWGSRYSQASECVNRPQAFNRVISVGYGKVLPANTPEETILRELHFLGADIWNVAIDHSETIVPLWFKAMRKRRFRPILIDPAGNHVNGYGMIRLCRYFGRVIRSVTKNEKNVGFMMPTSRDAALGIISILGTGKTSVNLNYSAPVDTILGCIAKADVNTVVTTHAFFDKLCGKNSAFMQIAEKCKMLYLDEEEAKISSVGKVLSTAVIMACPGALLRRLWFTAAKLGDDAVILFSSGSEGTPKGVELTHKNVIANAQQCDYVVKLSRTDVMTALLPLFHSFGFTLTFVMPLLDGVPMVLCPDPTDIKTLARVCAQYKTTIMMGTPTFLRAIAINRWVHPMCLDSLRFIIAGAEKLRPEMREAFKLKFGKDIYEGYGCTELTPLATINAPNVLLDDFLTMEKCCDPSSIGLPPPGTVTAIVDPETNEFLPQGADGMLVVTGPQVMKGYLKDKEKTDNVILEIDGRRWYKTGDKCLITPDGFVQILGRYSRFAKLGGEMISLTAVELRIAETKVLDNQEFAVTAVPDSSKGERIVLLVKGDMDTEEISRNLRKSGIPPLMLPGSVFSVNEIPKLGSGKWDFPGMKKMAQELVDSKLQGR